MRSFEQELVKLLDYKMTSIFLKHLEHLKWYQIFETLYFQTFIRRYFLKWVIIILRIICTIDLSKFVFFCYLGKSKLQSTSSVSSIYLSIYLSIYRDTQKYWTLKRIIISIIVTNFKFHPNIVNT